MLSIDPDDDDEDEDAKKPVRPPAETAAAPAAAGEGDTTLNTSGHSGTNENPDTSTEDVQVLGAGDATPHISSHSKERVSPYYLLSSCFLRDLHCSKDQFYCFVLRVPKWC